MEVNVQIPQGITVTSHDGTVTVKGARGELVKVMKHPKVSITVDSNNVKIVSTEDGKKERAVVGAYESHMKNLFHGVTKGYTVTMHIEYTHFPITTKVVGDKVTVENFLGERTQRKARIVGKSKVEIKDKDVIITGNSKEDVGQTAGNIESATKVTGKDRRVFKDGIYIKDKIANE